MSRKPLELHEYLTDFANKSEEVAGYSRWWFFNKINCILLGQSVLMKALAVMSAAQFRTKESVAAKDAARQEG